MEKRISKQDILDMIKEYMQVEKIPPIITKQLNGYILSGISTLDIARCINYYCETLKKEISSIYGISFVPNILEEVQKYFKKLQEIRDQNESAKRKKYDNQIKKCRRRTCDRAGKNSTIVEMQSCYFIFNKNLHSSE